jgi:transcriptional regulator with XRE-family HTH domain
MTIRAEKPSPWGSHRMVKTSNKTATKVDKLIGETIRVQRLSKGLTQQELGSKLGVTFQQIQKYEKGTNRVGSGRLYQIAEIFEVPVNIFFNVDKASGSKRGPSPFDLLDDPLSVQMLHEFLRVGDKNTRRSLLTLVERIASTAKR